MQADVIPEVLWPRLSEFVAAQTGLHFPVERRVELQRALLCAAAEFGFVDGASCARWLLSSSLTTAQLHVLATHLTIGETYFFRDSQTFDALAEHILPDLIRARRGRDQRLRLWSAACSTGEEPYSLAILLRRLLPDWADWHVKILATDINDRSLRKAAEAVYGEWSFRKFPAGLRQEYFRPTAEGRFVLARQIRDCVTFANLNLAGDSFPSLATDTNAMDLILCRNVLMYFTPEHSRKLIGNLQHSLLDGAWLAVSPSECSQDLFRGFSTVNFPGSILYRKGRGESNRAPGSTPVWPKRAQAEVPTAPDDAATLCEPQTLPDLLKTAETLYAQGQYADVSDLLRSSTTTVPQRFSLLTRSLANQGKLDEALVFSERWIVVDKMDCSAHYLHAMILEEKGEREAARRALNRTLYLRPDFALAHFALGNLARADDRVDARRHFETALEVLRAHSPEEALPESEGLNAGRLMEIIATLLALPDRAGRPEA